MALESGTVPVGLVIGHVFDGAVGDLLARGFALMPLPQLPERDRLLKAAPALKPSAVPPGAWPGVAATSTVAQPVAWVAGPALGPDLTGKLVATISEPRNLARIEGRVDPVPPTPEGEAFLKLPGPLAAAARTARRTRSRPSGRSSLSGMGFSG